MKLTRKPLFLLVAVSSGVAIIFGSELLNPRSSTASGPSIRASYKLDSNLSDYRFSLESQFTDECISWSEERESYPEMEDPEFNELFCTEYVPISDAYSPRLREFSYEITITVSGLPRDWMLCANLPPGEETQLVNRSIWQYEEYFLPTKSILSEIDYMGGEGGETEITATKMTSFATGMYTHASNNQRPVWHPRAFICGPDSSLASGFGWRLIEGKPITLPPINRW